MTDREYSTAELMACVLSRRFPNGAWGATGANSQIATAAMQLARLTTAPDLTLMVGGSGCHNPEHPLVWSSGDARWGWGAESIFSIEDVVNWELGGFRKRRTIACFGGMQIDRLGNVNLIGVGGEYPRLKVRGPGTVGLYFATRFHQVYLFVAHHDPRIFPERVEFVSAPGRTAEREKFCPPHSTGPELCVTPLCVFGFADDGEMQVESVHPGVSFDEVRDRTGWDVKAAAELGVTQPPTELELTLLRERIDPSGILRSLATGERR